MLMIKVRQEEPPVADLSSGAREEKKQNLLLCCEPGSVVWRIIKGYDAGEVQWIAWSINI